MPGGNRAKHWRFTQFDTSRIPSYDQSIFDYLVYQKERCPSTNRDHYQGYFALVTKKSLVALKKIPFLVGANLGVCNGTPAQNRAYCTKEDTRIEGPWEFGELPRGQGNRTDLEAVADDIKAGANAKKICEDHMTTYIKYHAGIEKAIYRSTKVQSTPPIVMCFYGPSNVGKSYTAKNMFGSYFLVTPKKGDPWFDGYQGEDVLLIDEYEGHWDIAFLKVFLDDRKCQLPVKHGFTWNTSKYIILTSNVPPLQWYPTINSVQQHALMRRLVHLYELKGSSWKDAQWLFGQREIEYAHF